ncbi:thermonuclease family protein [Maliponia aquimaris]|uniref:Succinoglycan biosynthesis protein ExoI n=1 Tax=Maliponia aquimaris TaxID=1673631 RepID=A0A238KLR0_9RHOB|nr:thermonuclease family protein [Maliponia aquimaris]SMX43694.1 Succinoglycan biosynthesis protein ExoI [Maliponia aquimaris]
MLRLCFALVLLALGGAASADVAGVVRVVDGDTLVVADTRVRLHGIDAPETDQHCGGQGVPAWNCGAWVTGEVRARYDGRMASCVTLETDRYGRSVARCTVDGVDVGAELVRSGLAFAYRKYSEAYVAQERVAAVRRAGLHATGIQSPEAYRRTERRILAAQHMAFAPEGCVIKGNVSSSSGARIYHMPGQTWYAGTKISEARGERWFCSEAEARAAGWRPARH